MKRILHVGCGKQPLPEFLPGYQEVRMDIDPECNPDIVASLTDMGDIGEFDAIYGSHVLEHFYLHDARKVMSECHRVLRPNGYVIMIVPNLKNVQPTKEVVYDSPAGPVTGLDMFYGMDSMVERNPYMAHKTGFYPETLAEVFGMFSHVRVKDLTNYNLMGLGVKS